MRRIPSGELLGNTSANLRAASSSRSPNACRSHRPFNTPRAVPDTPIQRETNIMRKATSSKPSALRGIHMMKCTTNSAKHSRSRTGDIVLYYSIAGVSGIEPKIETGQERGITPDFSGIKLYVQGFCCIVIAVPLL